MCPEEVAERSSGPPPATVIDAADLSRALRGFAATLVLFMVLMAWFLSCFAAGFTVGVVPIGFVSSYWVALLPYVILPVCLGVSLLFARRATRCASETVRLKILGARVSFYLGILLVLETVPVFLAGVFDSHYGPSKGAVDFSIWLGLAVVAPFLVSIFVSTLLFLRRMGDGRLRDTALLALIGGSIAVVTVPLVAIVVDSAYALPYGSYWWTPPGFHIVTLGVGLEAAVAFLLAVLFPAHGLALPAYRAHVGMALVLALATMILGGVSLLILVGDPRTAYFGPYWWYFRVFGFEGVPWATWGPVASVLGIAVAVLLFVAHRGTYQSLQWGTVAAPADTWAVTRSP